MAKRKSKNGSVLKRSKRAPKNEQHSAVPPITSTQFNVQTALNQASRLFSLGRLDEAESMCRKILAIEPENIPTLRGIGKIAQQTGRLVEAEQYFSKLIRLLPESPEAYNDLGLILRDLGRLNDATQKFQKATELNPVYTAAHCNLGNLYFSQKNLTLAITCYQQVINIKPHDSNAHFNLANAYRGKKLFDEAIASYHKVLSLQPNHTDAMTNFGLLLRDLGRLDEAGHYLQTAVNNAPGNIQISDYLVNLLNFYMPNIKTDSPYFMAQKSLAQISKEYASTSMIADETVRQLYQQCHSILAFNKLRINTNFTRIFRGALAYDNCYRHKMVFGKFKIIPEYCFDCYKVVIEPRTLMEFFKLVFVFDKLKLPNDNTRKCMIEDRPGISGTYKGLIYCKSRDAVKEILKIVRPIVDETISKGIPISQKRGCSEFQIAYPTFSKIIDNKNQQMKYNEEWRKHEAYADKNMISHTDENPHNNFTFNHSGFTLLDALVMRKWLAYAEKIGDSSFQNIMEPTLPKSSPHS